MKAEMILAVIFLTAFQRAQCPMPPHMERYPRTNMWDFEVELFNFINETSIACLDGIIESNDKFKFRISDTQAYYFCLSNLPWFNGVDRAEKPDDYMEMGIFKEFKRMCDCKTLTSCLRKSIFGSFWREKRQSPNGPATRKEYRMLSREERQRLHTAFSVLKSGHNQPLNYDALVAFHLPNRSPGAHFGAAFLPWHREYLRILESALRSIDPSVSLPYWDSTMDEGLPVPSGSVIWTTELFGNGNGPVVSGPFANWKATDGTSLTRSAGRGGAGSLYRPLDIDYILGRSNYGQLTACIDPYFESIHGAVHAWVGGHMGNIQLSPNDPVFWMHHAFVDYLWEQFRQQKQSPQQRETEYPVGDAACSPPHYSDAPMLPFSINNIQGMSNTYTQFYRYQPRPTCSSVNPTCGSEFLFCDIRRYRCLSKVAKGGDCGGYEGLDVCYQSRCLNRKCD